MSFPDTGAQAKLRRIRPWLVVFLVGLVAVLATQAAFAWGPRELTPAFLTAGVVSVAAMAIALIRMIQLWRKPMNDDKEFDL